MEAEAGESGQHGREINTDTKPNASKATEILFPRSLSKPGKGKFLAQPPAEGNMGGEGQESDSWASCSYRGWERTLNSWIHSTECLRMGERKFGQCVS